MKLSCVIIPILIILFGLSFKVVNCDIIDDFIDTLCFKVGNNSCRDFKKMKTTFVRNRRLVEVPCDGKITGGDCVPLAGFQNSLPNRGKYVKKRKTKSKNQSQNKLKNRKHHIMKPQKINLNGKQTYRLKIQKS